MRCRQGQAHHEDEVESGRGLLALCGKQRQGRPAGSAHTEGSWAWWAMRGKMEKGKGGPGARELAQSIEF
jgi:hypothetical protein